MQMIMYIKIEVVVHNLYNTNNMCFVPDVLYSINFTRNIMFMWKIFQKPINNFYSKINDHENIPKYWSHSSARIIRLLITNQTFYNERGILFFIWLLLRVGPGTYVIAHHIWMTKYFTCPYWLTKTWITNSYDL